MPNGLVQGCGGGSVSEGLDPFNRTTGIFAGKSNKNTFHQQLQAVSQQVAWPSDNPVSARSAMLAGTPPPWGWSWSSSHTGGFKSHVVYRKRLVCSLSMHCFILVFTSVWKRTHCYISADSNLSSSLSLSPSLSFSLSRKRKMEYI